MDVQEHLSARKAHGDLTGLGGVGGIDKAQGLHEMAEYMGLKTEEIMAFGDGGNDVEMLKRAGTGIAMDNAPEAVKEISDGTTGSNNSQGVLAWLEDHLGLAN